MDNHVINDSSNFNLAPNDYKKEKVPYLINHTTRQQISIQLCYPDRFIYVNRIGSINKLLYGLTGMGIPVRLLSMDEISLGWNIVFALTYGSSVETEYLSHEM